MSTSTHTVRIARTPEEVFPWLLDVARRLRWVEGLRASEPATPGEPAAGSRYRETIAQHGVTVSVETTIEELDAPRLLALRAKTRGLGARTRTTLEPDGDGTLLTATLETHVSGFAGRLVGGVAARQAGGSLERSLQTLKLLAEAEREG